MLGWPLVLTPLQILYINLVTDGLPALALAVEPGRKEIMKEKPRKGKSIFEPNDRFWFAEVSIITAVATLFAFSIGLSTGRLEVARALSFTTIILVQQFIFIDIWVRSKSFLKLKVYKNAMFLLAFFLPLLIHPFIIYNSYLGSIFKVSSISIGFILLSVFVSGSVLLSSEIRKALIGLKHKNN